MGRTGRDASRWPPTVNTSDQFHQQWRRWHARRVIDEKLWADLVGAGVTDPGADYAARRKRALELLIGLGATVEELKEHASDLGYVAARIVNGAQPTMTRRQLAERC